MRIAYLDCFSGISGDMFLGALVDCGVPAELLEETVAKLDLGARLEILHVVRGGIGATKVNVFAGNEAGDAAGDRRERTREVHGDWKHEHGAPHSHHAHPARGLGEIRGIIEKAPISENVKATAICIFEILGAAESEIHNIPLDAVHFHEVGAVDAMVDVVCAAVGAEALGVDEWVCSPLNVGGGTVECAHGTLPVPAPATVKLLAGAPVYSSGPQVELVTPTGAAIVKTLVKRFAAFPAMRIERSGYGAGSRELARYPNLLRMTVGEAVSVEEAAGSHPSEAVIDGVATEQSAVLETNLDDLSPQVLAYAMEKLLVEGALDVFSTPVQMKKNRAGAILTVLAKMEDADRLTRVIFAETSTLGVRRRNEQRQVLMRRWESVETPWGPVRIKIANMNGAVANYAPEFEDCRRIAEQHRVPLKKVIDEALRSYGTRPH